MVRKGWLVILVVFSLVLGISVGASAVGFRKSIEVDYSGVKLLVDGKVINTGESRPFIVVSESRTYIPARFLAEALGAKVGYDAQTNSVMIFTPNHAESATESGITTFHFPYYGATMKWPAAGELRPGSGNLVLHESPNATLLINRVPFAPNTLAFDGMIESILAGLQVQFPIDIAEAGEVIVPGSAGAVELKGTANLGGRAAPVWLRFVADTESIWMIMVMTAPDSPMGAAAVNSFLNTFSLGH